MDNQLDPYRALQHCKIWIQARGMRIMTDLLLPAGLSKVEVEAAVKAPLPYSHGFEMIPVLMCCFISFQDQPNICLKYFQYFAILIPVQIMH